MNQAASFRPKASAEMLRTAVLLKASPQTSMLNHETWKDLQLWFLWIVASFTTAGWVTLFSKLLLFNCICFCGVYWIRIISETCFFLLFVTYHPVACFLFSGCCWLCNSVGDIFLQCCLSILADHVHAFMTSFQQDNAPCHKNPNKLLS